MMEDQPWTAQAPSRENAAEPRTRPTQPRYFCQLRIIHTLTKKAKKDGRREKYAPSIIAETAVIWYSGPCKWRVSETQRVKKRGLTRASGGREGLHAPRKEGPTATSTVRETSSPRAGGLASSTRHGSATTQSRWIAMRSVKDTSSNAHQHMHKKGVFVPDSTRLRDSVTMPIAGRFR